MLFYQKQKNDHRLTRWEGKRKKLQSPKKSFGNLFAQTLEFPFKKQIQLFDDMFVQAL